VTTRVLVVDDQALLRTAFSSLIDAEDDLEVVGAAADGREAVQIAARLRPDVVVMDVRMPVMDGIEATRQITDSTDVRALILTTFDLDEYVFAALRAGASGFLLKDTLPADLLTAIRVVAAGDALLAPSVTRRLIGEFARTSRPSEAAQGAPASDGADGVDRARGAAVTAFTASVAAGGPAGSAGSISASSARGAPGGQATRDRLTRLLTERELEVLTMVSRGMSNAEIAEQLTISPATAKTHVAHLLTKLDSRDRIQLVIIAYQSGLASLH